MIILKIIGSILLTIALFGLIIQALRFSDRSFYK